MLKIRPEQLQAIAGGSADLYVAQATEYVRTAFPAWHDFHGPDEVAAVIRKAMADAPACGFARAHDVTGLLTLMILLGADFAAEPVYAWARDILAAKAIAPDEKIRLILQELTKG